MPQKIEPKVIWSEKNNALQWCSIWTNQTLASNTVALSIPQQKEAFCVDNVNSNEIHLFNTAMPVSLQIGLR